MVKLRNVSLSAFAKKNFYNKKTSASNRHMLRSMRFYLHKVLNENSSAFSNEFRELSEFAIGLAIRMVANQNRKLGRGGCRFCTARWSIQRYLPAEVFYDNGIEGPIDMFAECNI